MEIDATLEYAIIAAGLTFTLKEWKGFMDWMREEENKFSEEEEKYMQNTMAELIAGLMQEMPELMQEVSQIINKKFHR